MNLNSRQQFFFSSLPTKFNFSSFGYAAISNSHFRYVFAAANIYEQANDFHLVDISLLLSSSSELIDIFLCKLTFVHARRRAE